MRKETYKKTIFNFSFFNMLTYLTRIHKKLLKEGSLVEYLSYASGEIIIVVVGIILALYLNNWNQERKNHKLEIQYYQSIKNQLNEDRKTLIDVMDYDQGHFDQFVYAKRLYSLNDKNMIDTLGKITLNMVKYGDFRRKSNVYQTLVNSGEIVIINNNKIKDCLQSLEENYMYINRLEENHATIVFSQILPDLRQMEQLDPLKVEDTGALFSYKFQNYFDILIILMTEKREAYKQAENKINSTIELIDRELKD